MLTDEQIKAIDVKTLGSLHFARAIEAETLKAHQQAIEAAGFKPELAALHVRNH